LKSENARLHTELAELHRKHIEVLAQFKKIEEQLVSCMQAKADQALELQEVKRSCDREILQAREEIKKLKVLHERYKISCQDERKRKQSYAQPIDAGKPYCYSART